MGTHNALKKPVREAVDRLIDSIAKATGKSDAEVSKMIYKGRWLKVNESMSDFSRIYQKTNNREKERYGYEKFI